MYFVLQILNLSEELTHSRRIPFPLDSFPAAQMIRRFAIGLHVFLRNRFFVIPQVLGNLLLDFLRRFYLSSPSQNFLIIFEPCLPIDSPDKAPVSETQVLCW